MTADDLKEVMRLHGMWLRGEYGGKRADLLGADLLGADLLGADLCGANLREADLREANLRGAKLLGANLCGANLREADLCGANLREANLRGAKLLGANLCGANLREADLREADLTGANLLGANLRGANLRGANLRGANLLCAGNMAEIRTMQIDRWGIGYTADTLQIGCQRHAIDKWRRWDTDAGRKWISAMDRNALKWAERNLALVMQIIDANPATPTGHEAAQ